MAVCAVESSTLADVDAQRAKRAHARRIDRCAEVHFAHARGRMRGLKLRDGGSRHRARRVVVHLRGVAPEDLREQWILGWRCRAGHPVDARHGARIQRARREFALREEIDQRVEPALLERDHQQLDEGALAHDDLPIPGIGHRQGPLAIDMERDGAALAQVRQPGLAIVRVGGEERVAERPSARIRFVAGPLPGGHAFGRIVGRACRHRGESGADHAAADQPDEPATAMRILVISHLTPQGPASHRREPSHSVNRPWTSKIATGPAPWQGKP